MSEQLAILIPALGRPHRVTPTLDAIERSTPGAKVLFLTDHDDSAVNRAVRDERNRSALSIEVNSEGGNYATKINRGVELTHEPYIFTAANDLEPYKGWFSLARLAMVDGVEVVGINDLIDRSRQHATHFLITRAYAERPTIDGQPGPMCTEYSHWWVDDELIATAKKRGVYAYAADAQVLHVHPDAGLAPMDDVYEMGRSQARRDRRLFRHRSSLWT